jgi:hypothetical protein
MGSDGSASVAAPVAEPVVIGRIAVEEPVGERPVNDLVREIRPSAGAAEMAVAPVAVLFAMFGSGQRASAPTSSRAAILCPAGALKLSGARSTSVARPPLARLTVVSSGPRPASSAQLPEVAVQVQLYTSSPSIPAPGTPASDSTALDRHIAHRLGAVVVHQQGPGDKGAGRTRRAGPETVALRSAALTKTVLGPSTDGLHPDSTKAARPDTSQAVTLRMQLAPCIAPTVRGLWPQHPPQCRRPPAVPLPTRA